MRKAILVDTVRGFVVFDIGETGEQQYESIRDAVGGILQYVPLGNGLFMWCHDEGKLLGLPVNGGASLLWRYFHGETDFIAGPAVITGGPKDELTLGLTQDDIEYIIDIWEDLSARVGLIIKEG
jgi:hypothetical protein